MTFEQWLEKQHPESRLIRHEVVAGWLREAWVEAFQFGYKAGMLDDGGPAEDYEPPFTMPKPPEPPENYTFPGAM